MNGHSPLWDLTQPPDKRGEEIEDWVLDNNLAILNNGSPTRINKATGNESTPDLTAIGRKWDGKCTWETCDQIGTSDHYPIKITISSKVTHQSVLGKSARILRFNKTMTDAAMKHVGKTKPRKTS